MTPTLAMLGLVGVIWILLGIAVVFGLHPSVHLASPLNILLGGAMLAAGLAILVLAVGLAQRNRWAYHGAVVFLAGSTLAIVFDQVGWADLLFALVSLLPVLMLVKDRRWYLVGREGT